MYVVRITRADIGARVVIRRRIAGPVPLTDVIGLLQDWSDGTLVVARANGEIVEIPESDLVAAKVVPPPPRRRPRRPPPGLDGLDDDPALADPAADAAPSFDAAPAEGSPQAAPDGFAAAERALVADGEPAYAAMGREPR